MKQLTKSTQPVSQKSVKREWHLIDAKGKIVGRIAPLIAKLLQGKHKINYLPNLDMGDFVVVINATLVQLTGHKWQQKIYARYSGYPGGLKQITAGEMLKRHPERIIQLAVSGMLPKNKLRDLRLGRLFVFPNEHHGFSDKITKK